MSKYYNEKSKDRIVRYQKENREMLNLNLPKGKKAEYKEYAAQKGMSLTQLFVKLIEDDMNK